MLNVSSYASIKFLVSGPREHVIIFIRKGRLLQNVIDLSEEFWQWMIEFLLNVSSTDMDNTLFDIRVTDAHP